MEYLNKHGDNAKSVATLQLLFPSLVSDHKGALGIMWQPLTGS